MTDAQAVELLANTQQILELGAVAGLVFAWAVGFLIGIVR